MTFNFFGFGRKRKTRRSVRKTTSPDKGLVRMCKKYGIKVTKKSGSKRIYKKSSVLKKQCARKIRKLIKMHFGAKKSAFGRKKGLRTKRGRKTTRGRTTRKRTTRRRTTMRSMFGLTPRPMPRRIMPAAMPLTRFQRFKRYGAGNYGKYLGGAAALAAAGLGAAGAYRMKTTPGDRQEHYETIMGGVKKPFNGARNIYYNNRKTAAAPKAPVYTPSKKNYAKRNPYEKINLNQPADPRGLVEFGKRSRGRRGIRRARFGNGGNPSLSGSMGYEFCSNGGGVLGSNSTGLFPTPCMGGGMAMGPASAFGRRYRR